MFTDTEHSNDVSPNGQSGDVVTTNGQSVKFPGDKDLQKVTLLQSWTTPVLVSVPLFFKRTLRSLYDQRTWSEMVRSRIPLLFLLLLQRSVTNGKFFYQTVRKGDDVTLSCEKKSPQTQCETTNWSYTKDRRTTVLFRGGQKAEEDESVKLLQNCSLVLLRVTEEQTGDYVCERGREWTDTSVSVASLSQEKEKDSVTLTCSVSTSSGSCVYNVKWFNNNVEVTRDDEELQISPSDSGCDVSVSFKDPSPPSHFYHTLKCQIKRGFSRKTPLTLIPRPPGDETTTIQTTQRTRTTFRTASPWNVSAETKLLNHTAPNPVAPPSAAALWLRHVLLSVALSALLCSVAAVLLWARVKGRREPQRRRTVEAGGAVLYENVGEPSASFRVRGV